MVAWVALGVGVVGWVWAALLWRRLSRHGNVVDAYSAREERRTRRVEAEIDQLRAGIDSLQIKTANIVQSMSQMTAPRPRRVLEHAERLELQSTWGHLVCPSCGTMHPGLCPRVRRQRIERGSGHEIVATDYWPNDQWAPPPEALTADDVFGSVAAAAHETIEQVKQSETRRADEPPTASTGRTSAGEARQGA